MKLDYKQCEYIMNNARKMKIVDMATELGIDTKELSKYIMNNNIKVRGPEYVFMKEQIDYIFRWGSLRKSEELLDDLKKVINDKNLDRFNVIQFCRSCGIRLGHKKNKISGADITRIKETQGTQEIQENLDEYMFSKEDKYYININSKNMRIKELSKILKKDSEYIYKYCMDSNLKFIGKTKVFTPVQVEYIFENSEKYTTKKLSEKLNETNKLIDISAYDVRYFCDKYNIKYLRYIISNEKNKEEMKKKNSEIIEYIKNNYLELEIKEMAKNLDVDTEEIEQYIKDRPVTFKRYKMVKYKKEHPTTDVFELSKIFGYSIPQVLRLCRELGYTFNIKDELTEKEIEFIENNFKHMPKSKMSEELGVQILLLNEYENTTGNKFKYYRCVLTEEQRKYIKNNAEEKTVYQIELELNYEVPISSIQEYVDKLVKNSEIKIKVDSGRAEKIKLTDYQKKYMKENAAIKTEKQVAQDLKIKVGTIKAYCKKHNIDILKETKGRIEKEELIKILIYLRKNYGIMSVKQMSIVLERGTTTLNTIIKTYRIEKIDTEKPYIIAYTK